MTTYNHEQYIAQAIDSVLMQQTNFPIELIIGEDCSTDNTRQIVLDFQRRYPTVIRPLLPQQNLGAGRNFVATLEAGSGEFLAILEGDDYWTHRDKLQRQVELLERKADCALCFHKINAIREPGGEMLFEHPPVTYRKPILKGAEVAREKFIPTCSMVFRRKFLPRFDDSYIALKVGDWPLSLLIAEQGDVAYIDEVMGHYRIHGGGTWSSRPLHEQWLHLLPMFEYVAPRLSAPGRAHILKQHTRTLTRLASYYQREGDLATAKSFFNQAFWGSIKGNAEPGSKLMRLFLELYFPLLFRLLRRGKRLWSI